MKKFVDTYYIERKNTDSLKWDGMASRYTTNDLIPLWVADMDFKAPECIQEALQNRLAHGVYGYSVVPQSYFDAFINWMKQQHQTVLEKEWIRFATGVVQGIRQCVHAFTQQGEAVVILTPVYPPFYACVEQSKRKLVEVNLKEVGTTYEIDFDKLEEAFKLHEVKLMVHCSPHNPVGRVWTKEEQLRLLDLCEQYGVILVSDEIHQDFSYQSNKHYPMYALNHTWIEEGVIALTSVSKTFNVAGLTHSLTLIRNETLRKQFDHYIEYIGENVINVMGMIATQAGYESGETWLNELKEVILANEKLIREQFSIYFPEVTIYELQGTYLLWMNVRPLLKDITLTALFEEKCGVAVNYGETFGKDYQGYVRINLATHPEHIQKWIKRLKTAL